MPLLLFLLYIYGTRTVLIYNVTKLVFCYFVSENVATRRCYSIFSFFLPIPKDTVKVISIKLPQ